MRVLIDTNIYLDVALNRESFAEASLSVIKKVVASDGLILVAPHSLATIHYLCEKQIGKPSTRELIGNLLQLVEIAKFEHQDAVNAFKWNYNDFEDAMIMSAALSNKANYVITRNSDDFPPTIKSSDGSANIKVTTPEWFLDN